MWIIISKMKLFVFFWLISLLWRKSLWEVGGGFDRFHVLEKKEEELGDRQILEQCALPQKAVDILNEDCFILA